MITDTELERIWQDFLAIVAPKPSPPGPVLRAHPLRRPRWYRRGVGYWAASGSGVFYHYYNYCLDCQVRPAQHARGPA